MALFLKSAVILIVLNFISYLLAIGVARILGFDVTPNVVVVSQALFMAFLISTFDRDGKTRGRG